MLTPVLWRVWSRTTTLPAFKTRQIQPLFRFIYSDTCWPLADAVCKRSHSPTWRIMLKMMCSYTYVRDCVRLVCFLCYLLMLFLKNLLCYWINLESTTTTLFWWYQIPGSCNGFTCFFMTPLNFNSLLYDTMGTV